MPPVPDPPAAKPLPLNDLLGTWTNTVDTSKIEIRLDEDRSHILLIGKGGRQWKGQYLASLHKLLLFRTPAPEEMNPAVPEWARKSPMVAGRLRWQIELQPFSLLCNVETNTRFKCWKVH